MSNETTEQAIQRIRDRWNGDFALVYTKYMGPISQQAARIMRNEMELNTAQSVLEVAAGAGDGSLEIANIMDQASSPSMQKKVLTVTDYSPKMVEMAKERIFSTTFTHVNANVTEANALDLSQFPSSTYDRYIANLCLQMIPDSHKMLLEAHRVLTSEGIAGFTVWGRLEHSGLWEIIRATDEELGLEPIPALNNFNFSKDITIMREKFMIAGFSQVMIWPHLCIAGTHDINKIVDFLCMIANRNTLQPDLHEQWMKVATQHSEKWLAKSIPIAFENYIILARP